MPGDEIAIPFPEVYLASSKVVSRVDTFWLQSFEPEDFHIEFKVGGKWLHEREYMDAPLPAKAIRAVATKYSRFGFTALKELVPYTETAEVVIGDEHLATTEVYITEARNQAGIRVINRLDHAIQFRFLRGES